MAVQTIYEVGEEKDGKMLYQIDAKYDAAVYALAIEDCICQGIGDEFKLNYASDSLNAYFNEGSEAVIGGSFFKITSLHSISLPANSTFYLCATIDLSAQNGYKGQFSIFPQLTNIRNGNLNGSGSARDLVLYQITTSSSGVTSVVDKRVVRGKSTSISGISLGLSGSTGSQVFSATNGGTTIKFQVISEANYNKLSTKDSNTLYFIPES